MEGSRPMRATALLFARSRALVRPASRGTREDTTSRPPHPLTPQMPAPEYRSGERLLRTRRRRPAAGDPSRSRCCIREKQRRRADCSYPCGWALPASVSRCQRAAGFLVARLEVARAKCVSRGVAVGRRAHRSARGSLGAVSDARGGVMSELLLDAAGRRRSPATMPEFHAGRPPRNKGIRYPADPPTIEEIVAVMRRAGDTIHGQRLRGLIVVLWRAGLRIHRRSRSPRPSLDARRGRLCADVYCRRLDRQWTERETGVLVRYADDLVVLCHSQRVGRSGAGVAVVDPGRVGLGAQAGQDPDRAPAGGRRGP